MGLPDENKRAYGKAFSLVELLAVLSIVAIFAGVIGFAFFRGNESTALQGAQAAMNSVLSAARAYAVSNDTLVRVIVNTDPNAGENYLRFVGAIAMGPGESGASDAAQAVASNWRSIGVSTLLPRGTAIVPPVANSSLPRMPGVLDPTFNALTENLLNPTTIVWNWHRYSTPPSPSDVTWPGTPTWANPAYSYFTVKPRVIQGHGSTEGSWIVAAATPDFETGVKFTNFGSARGLYMSRYGVVRMISDPSGL